MVTTRNITRRSLPLLALAAAIRPAAADTIDLSLACDTAFAPALRKVAAAYAAKTSARVFVFPTGPGLIVPQLERDIQNDIVATQIGILDQLQKASIIAAVPTAPRWRNPLVIAGLTATAPLDQAFAAPDPTPAFAIDCPALVTRLELKPAHLIGALNTGEVASLLLSGVAQAGLVHMSDVRANPGLAVIRPVPPEIQPPQVYAAAVTRLASRPNPQGFIAFLATPEASALLTEAGLELQT
jgi:molybdate transport system substrate-binding protein